MSEQALAYLKENRTILLEKLNEFLSIPSVSTDSDRQQDIHNAAGFLVTYLTDIGFENIEKKETAGHPLVYAEYNGAGPDAPTVLLYGHYDVQPADPLELWDSDPFEPEVRKGRLFARGSSDDKGQVFMHLAVFEAYMKTEGKIPLNVKVCIEGEEEIGSENLYEMLNDNKELFKADFAVISDSGMVADNQPTILYGLKGFTGIEINVTGPDHDLHSGIYGGAIRNPIMALNHILSSMKNEEEVVTVAGFYDDVDPLTDEERKLIEAVQGEDFPTATGAPETASEKGYTAKEHTMARPTFEINGIYGGYQGEGTKTIIPSTATAKITCRLVPGQDPEKIQQLLENHIERTAPSGVTVDIKKEKLSAKAYKVEPTNSLIKKAANSYTKAFGKETVYVRMGGSIPVVEWIEEIYNMPIVLLGFGTPEDRLHSPNESFPLNSFDKGMETLVYYWNEVKET
ncbi:acetylornithine deacetylase/succinyl-diaminopimelate desuccinylase-like protein [Virgibacillus natechei]|uniref:Acetylornithine deacetylase/succinyl-diaminopimelate desuccinylase-like protein n=1 Tax=Virgibacillus natechei TaxID=1216297 RepID=A0ABS4IDC6_9BACI|nr:dipeptidase [Virgibacillus natechei]MBP1968947.1 acetylornithine deacetylase/succinyl-diaminopimelate desuccinylase-like protein [Virgibacillus natechei]UZD14870.1 dipeptidase [Virgibacillus natechei]